MYMVVKLWGDKRDEKTLNDLVKDWVLIAVVPMLGKVDPLQTIPHSEYQTWPVAYLKKRAKRVV